MHTPIPTGLSLPSGYIGGAENGSRQGRMSETVTEGTLLGGRVSYAQRTDGYRTGIEPVLLAASVPARAGDRVVEGGTGAGAGLLCVAARVTGIEGVGLEADAGLVSLAARNFAANGFGSCRAEVACLPAMAGLANVAHALANPPWHDPSGTMARDPGRRLAKQRTRGSIAAWAAALAGVLARGGTLSMIVPAGLLTETAGALEAAGCGGVSLFPLWPRAGVAAKLVVVRGVRASRAPGRVLAGLALHAADGAFTGEAEAVLRDGAALDF